MSAVSVQPHAQTARGQRLDGKMALGATGEFGRRVAVGDLGAAVALNHRGRDTDAIASARRQLQDVGALSTGIIADLASSAK